MADDGLVEFPLLPHGITQPEVRLGRAGIRTHGAMVTCYGVGSPLQLAVCIAQADVECGIRPVYADRPLDVLYRNLVLAQLGSHHAEKMNRIGLIRLDGENLPINLLGGLQPTGLMVLERNGQCFGNRCHAAMPTLRTEVARTTRS